MSPSLYTKVFKNLQTQPTLLRYTENTKLTKLSKITICLNKVYQKLQKTQNPPKLSCVLKIQQNSQKMTNIVKICN